MTIPRVQPRRRAAVTAGAGGIGLAIVERLVADGYDVVVGDLDEQAGRRLADRLPVTFVAMDAGAEPSVREFADACGDVHSLVTNVGVRGGTGDIWALPLEDFRRTTEINTWSHLLCAQLLAPAMMRAGEGVIVTIASGAARTPTIGRAPYAISKYALLGLTKSLAHELAPWGIRCNAVLPGNVDNERFLGSLRLHAEHEGVPFDDVLERFLDKAPLKRLIPMSEIAGAVSYLVSDDAKGVTGVFLDVSGGQF